MTASVATPTIGWVFGEPVTAEMLRAHVRANTGPAAVGDDEVASYNWAAGAVMTELLARREAARRGLDGPIDLPAAVATELVGDGGPSPAAVSAYFQVNQRRYDRPERRRVRHVLCADERSAALVARRARTGEPIDQLARQFSTDRGSRHSGGDLGPVQRGELTGAVEELVFHAGTDEVLGPVRSPFGWHVLVVYAIEEGRAADLASVRTEIEAELAGHCRREAYTAWFQQLMLEGITMAPGYDHPLRPSLSDRAHRH